MFRRPRPAGAALIGSALAVLVLAAPVAATAPVRSEIHETGVPCGGGTTYDLDLVVMTVSTSLGDRFIEHAVVDGTAVANTGAVVRFHHSWTTEFDFANGTMTLTGVAFGARVEGTDVRRMDRGRLVIDLGTGTPIFVAGVWPAGPFDPHAATCELIAAAA